jgi:hypothetical protein
MQKGREMQTLAFIDLIERQPEMWLDSEVAKPLQTNIGGHLP